jgi:hypothetical protein
MCSNKELQKVQCFEAVSSKFNEKMYANTGEEDSKFYLLNSCLVTAF